MTRGQKQVTNKSSFLIRRRFFKAARITIVTIAAVCVLLVVSLNSAVILKTEGNILSGDSDFSGYDCIIVFGCGIKPDSTPSDMLYDRVMTAVSIYLELAKNPDSEAQLPVILMSGDGKESGYNEPEVMKKLAVDAGVSEQSVLTDTLGLSTYETLERAQDIVSFEKALLVTQKYHLYRALYIADSLGIDASGVSADLRTYRGQAFRDLREAAARVKDFFKSSVKSH